MRLQPNRRSGRLSARCRVVRRASGCADRVTLIWPDGAIVNQWVEITAKSNANGGQLGLVSDDVFYFGNSVGDCDGDGEIGDGDYDVLVSQFGQRSEGGMLTADLDGDGRVGLPDFSIMGSRFGETVGAPTFPSPAPLAAPALEPVPAAMAAPPGLVTSVGRSPENAENLSVSASAAAIEQQMPTISSQLSANDEVERPAPTPEPEREFFDVLQGDGGGDGLGVWLDSDDLLVDVLLEAAGSQLSVFS